jgi:hypothetical protein
MTESVYQNAKEDLIEYRQAHGRLLIRQLFGEALDIEPFLLAALDAGAKAEARVRELEAKLGDAMREKDEYLIGLVQVSEWIDEEQKKHERRERGGQMFGTSHEPRVPFMVLLELERMVRPDALKYTRQCYFELTERAEKAEARVKELERMLRPDGLQYDLIERAEKAERERDEARTALDAISVPDTIALLKQRAEKAEARLRETAQILMAEVGATGPPNVEEAAARIVARVRELEMIFRPEALGPVPAPTQSAPGAELKVPRETIAPSTEPGPASVAEQEPAAEVNADGSGVTGEH